MINDAMKLRVLNDMDVFEHSCSGGECEYVLVESSKENRKKLYDIGLNGKE